MSRSAVVPVGEGTSLGQWSHVGLRDGNSWTWNTNFDGLSADTALCVAFNSGGSMFAIGYTDGTLALRPTENLLPATTNTTLHGAVRDLLLTSGGGGYAAAAGGILAEVARERVDRAAELGLSWVDAPRRGRDRVAVADVDDRLWNTEIGPSQYGDEATYRAAVLDQYKLYVEMADRISQRRGLTNTFFLTLNTSLVAVVAGLWPSWDAATATLLFALVIALGQCFAWYYLVRSYRQLNSAKYQVIGALEQRLPASPYWRAEWTALGEGKDRSKYWPLSHIEQWIPTLFGLTYLSGFITMALT